ncbi:hypothetical protein [uncultured Methanoregula sp.]|nr:hypothetical protein [uncultured Methanoregula sp.]
MKTGSTDSQNDLFSSWQVRGSIESNDLSKIMIGNGTDADEFAAIFLRA